MQGLFGGLASAAIRAINVSYSGFNTSYANLPIPYNVFDPRQQVAAAFISAAIGLIGGLFTGIFVTLVNK